MGIKLREYKTARERREALETELHISLPHIGMFSFQEAIASSKNCENLIGCVQVPLGIAGPLLVKHEEGGMKEYYLPLATTEGALVASISRGCKAITESGGATVMSKKIGITRAPVFRVANVYEGKRFISWVEKHQNKLKDLTEATSHHLQLTDIRPWQSGKNVFLRFRFDSHDAMGMNMATIAVAKAVSWIEQETTTPCTALSGNLCVDKKSNMLNFIEGRGIQVWADITIPQETVSSLLKTTATTVAEAAKQKLLYGSILSGSIGANAHAANVLAALFLATGQDIAHVTECSSVVTEVEDVAGDLYLSVYLPDLVIGTVGGGTGLATQHEGLEILGIVGGDNGKNAIQLAQVIGAAVLAGEISLLSALASHDLARAHQQLGRGGK